MIYKPGLQNKAADALSRMPPAVQLCSISAPIIFDLKIIKEEVEKDVKLHKVIAKMNGLKEHVDGQFSI